MKSNNRLLIAALIVNCLAARNSEAGGRVIGGWVGKQLDAVGKALGGVHGGFPDPTPPPPSKPGDQNDPFATGRRMEFTCNAGTSWLAGSVSATNRKTNKYASRRIEPNTGPEGTAFLFSSVCNEAGLQVKWVGRKVVVLNGQDHDFSFVTIGMEIQKFD